MKARKKSVFICEKNLRLSVRKTALLLSLILLLFSCIKLEENDKKYSARKLQKMLEGTWELTDYQIDGVSYLDTFLKVNTNWNCKTYTLKQWKNSSEGEKPDGYAKTGEFYGDCQTSSSMGYSFYPRRKTITFMGLYFMDPIHSNGSERYDVFKLENNELYLQSREHEYTITMFFIKK